MNEQVGLPSPVDVLGPVKRAVGEALEQGTGSVVDGLGGWLFSSLADLCSAVFGFVDKATRPNVTAAWFIDGSTGTGPYRATATVAATIMCVLVFAGIVQGIAQADVAGMVRRMVVNVPIAVVGIGGTVVVVQVLLDLTDAVSLYITSSVGEDTKGFVSSIQTLATSTGSAGAPLLVLGLLMLVAAIVVFVELLVRSLLIYLIVALCPLAWAALVWPAIQGALRKTLELLVAVILSKVVVALAIAVGAAALSGTALAGGQAPEFVGYTFTEPGAAQPAVTQPVGSGSDGSLTGSLGLLATGVATLAVAAFSPFLIARLLPFAEGAVVAQGTRGAPVRAGQQAWNVKYQLDVARRFGGQRSQSAKVSSPMRIHGGAGGKPAASGAKGGGAAGAKAGGAAGGSGAAAGTGGAAAVAGPVAVVAGAAGAAVKGGKKTVQRTQASVAEQSGAAGGAASPNENGAKRRPSNGPSAPSTNGSRPSGDRFRKPGGGS